MVSDQSRIDIKAGRVFPWHFQLLGLVLIPIAISLVADRPIIAMVMLLVSLIVLTSYEGLEIDKAKKLYREYFCILFFIKSGRKIKYDNVEKIFINSSKVKQKVYSAHTNQSMTFANMEFNGYIKFSDGTKVYLLSKRKKEKLLGAIRELAMFLETPVEDNTQVPH